MFVIYVHVGPKEHGYFGCIGGQGKIMLCSEHYAMKFTTTEDAHKYAKDRKEGSEWIHTTSAPMVDTYITYYLVKVA